MADITCCQDLAYGDHSLQKLDLYYPTNSNGARYPLIVYIHGGGWTDRDKGDYEVLGKHVAKQGYSCAILNYQLSPNNYKDEGIRHPTHTNDNMMALMYLIKHKDQYPYDLMKTTLIGHSAGAFMGSLLCFKKSYYECYQQDMRIRSVLCVEGIYDLKRLVKDYPDYLQWVVLCAFNNDPEEWEKESPTYIVNNEVSGDSSWPPFMVIYCPKDELLDASQGNDFVEALRSKNIETTYLELSGDEATHYGVVLGEYFVNITWERIKDYIKEKSQ